ncbi:hypothetical protein Cgig2_013763 [Carnegiea gigantea]|uniref:Uncharacterized protein n=1 Tax=Carnegiea gigantea TaxID=171969 RepID=A0A9Q1QE24_9CARY|nr:hypothetical protein Cgig2_013763 [Carnegiea gigantea]
MKVRLTAGGALLYFHWTNQTDHLSVDAIKWNDMVPVFQTYWAPTSQLFRRFEPALPAILSVSIGSPGQLPRIRKIHGNCWYLHLLPPAAKAETSLASGLRSPSADLLAGKHLCRLSPSLGLEFFFSGYCCRCRFRSPIVTASKFANPLGRPLISTNA